MAKKATALSIFLEKRKDQVINHLKLDKGQGYLILEDNQLLLIDINNGKYEIYETIKKEDFEKVFIDTYFSKTNYKFVNKDSSLEFEILGQDDLFNSFLKNEFKLKLEFVHRPAFNKIIGFRTKNPKKMIFSSISYLLVLSFVLSLIFIPSFRDITPNDKEQVSSKEILNQKAEEVFKRSDSYFKAKQYRLAYKVLNQNKKQAYNGKKYDEKIKKYKKAYIENETKQIIADLKEEKLAIAMQRLEILNKNTNSNYSISDFEN